MRILLVDDNAEAAHLVTRQMTRAGHTVEVMGSGAGVVQRLRDAAGSTDQPDLVILDHMMPGTSGGAVLEQLAGQPTTRSIPVILFSAVDQGTLARIAQVHPRCVAVQKGTGARALMDAVTAVTSRAD